MLLCRTEVLSLFKIPYSWTKNYEICVTGRIHGHVFVHTISCITLQRHYIVWSFHKVILIKVLFSSLILMWVKACWEHVVIRLWADFTGKIHFTKLIFILHMFHEKCKMSQNGCSCWIFQHNFRTHTTGISVKSGCLLLLNRVLHREYYINILVDEIWKILKLQ